MKTMNANFEEQLVSPEFMMDPYPVLHQLREQDPVYWSDAIGGWLLTRYDDVLAVCCRVAKLGRSSMTFHFEIYRDAEEAPLVSAELVYVNADLSSMQAAPLPDELRERVRRYERTAPQA